MCLGLSAHNWNPGKTVFPLLGETSTCLQLCILYMVPFADNSIWVYSVWICTENGYVHQQNTVVIWQEQGAKQCRLESWFLFSVYKKLLIQHEWLSGQWWTRKWDKYFILCITPSSQLTVAPQGRSRIPGKQPRGPKQLSAYKVWEQFLWEWPTWPDEPLGSHPGQVLELNECQGQTSTDFLRSLSF